MVFGFFNMLGVKELLLLLVIILIIFGPKKLPEIGRSFGEMLSNFRSGSKNKTGEEDGDIVKDTADKSDASGKSQEK